MESKKDDHNLWTSVSNDLNGQDNNRSKTPNLSNSRKDGGSTQDYIASRLPLEYEVEHVLRRFDEVVSHATGDGSPSPDPGEVDIPQTLDDSLFDFRIILSEIKNLGADQGLSYTGLKLLDAFDGKAVSGLRGALNSLKQDLAKANEYFTDPTL